MESSVARTASAVVKPTRTRKRRARRAAIPTASTRATASAGLSSTMYNVHVLYMCLSFKYIMCKVEAEEARDNKARGEQVCCVLQDC